MSRIVIKIGSNILTRSDGGLNHKRVAAIAKEISELFAEGHEVVLVSSGAIAAGMGKLGFDRKPTDIQLKQACAAVGQSLLMRSYGKSFNRHGRKVGQILLTQGIFSNRVTYLNSKNTMEALLSFGVVPIVNENDTISTEEIKFGDNDRLAALVAGLIEADRLIILSDVDGLYPEDPKKNPSVRLITTVEEITPDIEQLAGGAGSIVGTGGMYSKILAAKRATAHGIRVHIVSGRKYGLASAVLAGKKHGTTFLPQEHRISSRKGWIAYAVKSAGEMLLDDGAVKALKNGGKSLLPSGIVRVKGHFRAGDAVVCLDQAGRKVAKGIVNYAAEDIDRIKGKKTSDIESLLGFKYSDEVIHRDNLVLLG
ncbi:MAG: glutamate 5-kinase [Nitrospiraceae bacterium]|jgi:glutamate 5-kinase|nr:glutamate 5-kinase [Nitrospiraceae bacterium]